jgi:hypothetical protein
MTWTGMLRGCWNAGIGESQLRIEMPGGRGLKRPRTKFGCSAKEEEGEKVSQHFLYRVAHKKIAWSWCQCQQEF